MGAVQSDLLDFPRSDHSILTEGARYDETKYSFSKSIAGFCYASTQRFKFHRVAPRWPSTPSQLLSLVCRECGH